MSGVQTRSRRSGFGALAMLVPTMSAAAHDGQPILPHDLAGAWSRDPWVIALLAVSLGLYVAGARRMHARAHRPLGGLRRRALLFAAGWLILALSLLSPLHALGGALLSAHMVQHELLLLVATPLLVLGQPVGPMLWAMSPSWRRKLGQVARRSTVRGVWRVTTRPLAAALIHGVAIWLWHAPVLYEAGLRSEGMHALQHLAFIGTAVLFWWAALGGRRRQSGEVLVALFVTALHTGALGALLAFGESLWYPAYAATTGPWGLSPLADQQLAGLIMWIPGGAVYLVVALSVIGRWLATPRPAARGLARAVAALLVLAASGCRGGLDDDHDMRVAGGDPERGRIAISQYGCPTCHVIPGIKGATGTVGPPLTGMASRAYIAGVITNTPENMVRWIVDPPRVDSLTAMPALGVSDSLARHIAEYLYTLR